MVIGAVNVYTPGPEAVVQADTGAGKLDLTTCDWYSGAGDDSPPLPMDSVAIIQTSEGGRFAAVSCDDGLPKTALAGEKRIYSRNAAGAIMATVHLKGTGEIEIVQGEGIASVVIDPTGAISLSGTSVSLRVGEALGSFLKTLHAAFVAWTPAPNDGGGALKTALADWLAQVPPGP